MTDNQKSKQQSHEELKKKNEVLEQLLRANQERLGEAQETLEAIRNGAVDGLVRHTPNGNQIFILKGAEQPYRSLIEEMNEGALLISKNGTILYCNHGFAKLVEVPLDRIMGTNVRDWVSTSSVETLSNITFDSQNDDKRVFEVAFRTGKQQPVATQVSVTKVKMGSLNSLAFIVTDLTKHMEDDIKRYTGELETEISQRKEAQEALSASQKKYQDLIETTSDFIWEVDPHGLYTYCSPQIEKLWGIKPEEMIGKTPFDKMPPEAKEQGIRLLESFVVSQKPFSGVQVPSLDGKGKRIFLEVSGVPFFDNNGKLLGFRGISRDITERKKSEAELKASEEQLRRAIEDAPIPVIVNTEDGQVLQVSRTWTKLTGYSLNSIPTFDSWLTKAVYGEGADLVRDHMHDLFKGKTQTIGIEFPIRAVDGKIRYWSFSASSPGTLRDGRRFIVGMAVDITELKETEDNLKKTNEALEDRVRERTAEVSLERQRLYKVLETLPAYVILLDKNYHVSFANKVFRERFGESHGRRCYEYLFERDSPCENCETYKVLKTHGPLHWEWLGPDGRDYDIYDYPFIETDGSKLILEMGIDITERKKAEAAVQSERKRLFDVLETLPMMVCLLTKDYHVAFANRSFRQMFGESHDRYCYEYCYGRSEPCEFCETYKVFETNAPHHWEVKTPTGHYIEAFDYPFTDTDGTPLVLEVDIDVTERKTAEKNLKDAERLAAIGATAGMVGHDIRNPLQAIIGDVFLAKSDLASLPEGEAKEDLKESLEAIQTNTEYINKVVQDLQDFARPIKPSAQEISLKALWEDILFKNEVPENINVSCKVDKKVKKIISDPEVLKRILNNIVNNAFQAMPDGGKITVHAYQQSGDTIITVQDTGGGIPEDIKPKLFTPLFTTKSKGQGFGLAVVKRMTEALGGAVSFESGVGEGTKFTVRLPPRKVVKNNLV